MPGASKRAGLWWLNGNQVVNGSPWLGVRELVHDPLKMRIVAARKVSW